MANIQLTREARRRARGVALMDLSEQRLQEGRTRLAGAARGGERQAQASRWVGQRVPGGMEAEAQLTGERSRGLAEAARRPFWAGLQEGAEGPASPTRYQSPWHPGYRAPTAHVLELLGERPP